MSPKPSPTTALPLNTGAEIPALGLGTWQSNPGEVSAAVYHAIKVGYRHIDCAYVYGNEAEVGEGIKKALDEGLVKREDLFVVTKLWCTFHGRVEEGLRKSLEGLGLEYVDLYLMHWPVPMSATGNHPLFPKLPSGARDLDTSQTYIDTYKSLEALLPSGLTKAIGVANLSVPFLQRLLAETSVVPAANQIENHPFLPQQEIVDFCREKGIHVTAYSPLGMARGSSVLAKSVTPSRIEENKNLIALDAEDMAALADISKTKGLKRFVYPEFGVNMGFPDKQ
ncbi:hypothetical protein EG328_000951 [Venturia inaequalis]|uniref:NADP-dependent oxidoreductase domain-containing protein n=1 Tax=Venturia inaequalis TaxID=5025 RepID=A0A8H3VDK9_VENIN|nr:hypothetical protein EG328_000951 [Venturia inaequalis]